MFENNYLETAKKYESIFRAVLEDLKDNKRPLSDLFPANFNPKSSLEEIFENYSSGNRNGKFTICDFRIEKESALIYLQNIDWNKGGNGIMLGYKIKAGKEIEYYTDLMDWTLKT